MTICIFIKSPKEGRLDCPKYRENQLARYFFFAVQFNDSLVKRIVKTSRRLILCANFLYFHYLNVSTSRDDVKRKSVFVILGLKGLIDVPCS